MTKKMTIALTGASGFVGRHVLTHLVAADHQIRTLLRDPSRLTVKPGGLHVVKGDLFDPKALDELVSSADAVIHLVGVIMQRPGSGQTFERVHVQGVQNLLAAAGRGGVKRFIHMSALGSRPNAVSQYHRTKWLGEQAVRKSGVDYTIFRPSVIHGPDGEFMQMVRDFWTKLAPPFVPYFGAGLLGTGGAGRIAPVWVEDAARCFVAALTNDLSINETYPMGGPNAYTWPDFYQTVKQHLPRARNKKTLAVPVWKAKLMARLPGMPFNVDQVVMSQEDSVCDINKVQRHFAFELAPFEPTLADYADQL